MLSETIAELERLEKAATPGPWDVDVDPRDGGRDQIVECRTGRTLTIAFATSNGNEADVRLLALLRTHARQLLTAAKLSEARGRLAKAWEAAYKEAQEYDLNSDDAHAELEQAKAALAAAEKDS